MSEHYGQDNQGIPEHFGGPDSTVDNHINSVAIVKNRRQKRAEMFALRKVLRTKYKKFLLKKFKEVKREHNTSIVKDNTSEQLAELVNGIDKLKQTDDCSKEDKG